MQGCARNPRCFSIGRRNSVLTIKVNAESWKNRSALRITNGAVEAVLLRGGGHIAELRLAGGDEFAVNCLWSAPWATADPRDPDFWQLAEQYGADPAGKFLATYTGHALCLDIYGLPSPQDAARGIPLHGEASVLEWDLEPTARGCAGRVELPAAQIGFEREASLAEGAAVLFSEERVENRGGRPREIHWVQHLSLGPPFLAPGESSIQASLDGGRTWPLGYEGHERLRGDASFAWPLAPSADGDMVDLRLPFERPGFGFIAAGHVDSARQFAFIAALNFRLGLALVYCFRRQDFPWVAIWEENCARPAPPWNGAAQVRGMEFGTTPMPIGRDAIHELGNLFDTPASRVLEPGGVLRARYLAALSVVPPDWREITDVTPNGNGLALTGPRNSRPIEIIAPGLDDFLKGDTER